MSTNQAAKEGVRDGSGTETGGSGSAAGERWVTVAEAASLAQVSERTIRKRVSAGEIKQSTTVKKGRTIVQLRAVDVERVFPRATATGEVPEWSGTGPGAPRSNQGFELAVAQALLEGKDQQIAEAEERAASAEQSTRSLALELGRAQGELKLLAGPKKLTTQRWMPVVGAFTLILAAAGAVGVRYAFQAQRDVVVAEREAGKQEDAAREALLTANQDRLKRDAALQRAEEAEEKAREAGSDFEALRLKMAAQEARWVMLRYARSALSVL